MIIFVGLILVLSHVPVSERANFGRTANVFSLRTDIGVILCGVGVAFAIWARRHLGKNWGMPRSQKENPDLITTGPYTYVRHPIYTGVLLAILGSILASDLRGLILFVIVAAYFVYSAKTEERYMTEKFPQQYPSYKAQTKMIVPFVY